MLVDSAQGRRDMFHVKQRREVSTALDGHISGEKLESWDTVMVQEEP
ncbi:hypothetical protein HKBW3S42_01012 [Candidatus Hakubella thermalkaliphila]|uniref:Uncharacterized protein n=1 Tax=Candidatus Hakubella thermalkaliphila TaxID=2754717 RepID=A0A6V8PNQ9_9ACTN|nr:hypothetical protein HKBW3S42_01012 [Candidatus Hakubella thermalkaliphila]GFP37393.1 hypothetical protein HKBW3S44_01073 [Candidatus Hakubella thermalkaliphila]GFP43561.1 hypothetical protein HKBW3C_02691 [Candidatus Hakubella thermalkaliphila]